MRRGMRNLNLIVGWARMEAVDVGTVKWSRVGLQGHRAVRTGASERSIRATSTIWSQYVPPPSGASTRRRASSE